jgi:hypothetical protein
MVAYDQSIGNVVMGCCTSKAPNWAVASSPRAAGAMCDAAAALDPCVTSPHKLLAITIRASIDITASEGEIRVCLTIRGSHLSMASDLKLRFHTVNQKK